MRLFNLLFNFENSIIDTTTFTMYLFFYFCLTSISLIIGIVIFGFGSFLYLLEIGIITLSFLFGINFIIKFQFPVFFISRKHNYLSIISDYSNNAQGIVTEDFFPPFIFGYRNYFLSKAPRWWDFWSIPLKSVNRRINSSIFEWGYTKRIPTYHYYIVRGGERIQRVISNNFKRVTGTTHDSPIWVYTFGPKRKKYSWQDTEWGEWVYKWYYSNLDKDSEKLFFKYRRIRVQNMRLSNWLEKWSTSLDPKVVNSNYFLSGDKASPYSYDKFSFQFLRFSNINFVHKRTKIGFNMSDSTTVVVTRDDLSKRLNRFMEYVRSAKPDSLQFPLSNRKLAEAGDYILLDRDELFRGIVYTALAPYIMKPHITVHGKRDNIYWHSQYWRVQVYNSLIEFCTFIFESFYIYPFQKNWVNTQVLLENDRFFTFEYILNFNFFEYLEYLLMTGVNIYWISFLFFYFILFFAMFKIFSGSFNYFFSKKK